MKEFVKKFASLFSEETIRGINEETEFKFLDDWTSMTTLTLVAMIEDDYGVTLSSKDIRETDTVGELYELIKEKQ